MNRMASRSVGLLVGLLALAFSATVSAGPVAKICVEENRFTRCDFNEYHAISAPTIFTADTSIAPRPILEYRWNVTYDGSPPRSYDYPSVDSSGINFSPEGVGFPLGFMYTIQLTIVDIDLETSVTSVRLWYGENRPPNAVIAPLTGFRLGDPVRLDGTRSTDPDRDPFHYRFFVTRVSDGEQVWFSSDPVTILPGGLLELTDYDVMLWVVDSYGARGEVVVRLSPAIDGSNHPPRAVIAPLLGVHRGVPITLDGTGSTDADGDLLTYIWEVWDISLDIEVFHATEPLTVFTPPDTTEYRVILTVFDTELANTTAYAITRRVNSVPIAEAGLDISTAQSKVYLPCYLLPCDGTQENRSRDPDGDQLHYQWYLVDPVTGLAHYAYGHDDPETVLDLASEFPTFWNILLNGGQFEILLAASDSLEQGEDRLVISFAGTNLPPVANAGPDQTAHVKDKVVLQGHASSDPDGDPLTYKWNFTSVPTGSQTTLTNNGVGSQVKFIPKIPGLYVISLITHDGEYSSTPDTVVITVLPNTDAITSTLQQAITALNAMGDTSFIDPPLRTKLVTRISSAIETTNQGAYASTRTTLQGNVLAKMNGCATKAETPDSSDWINNCTDQGTVYPLVLSAITALNKL